MVIVHPQSGSSSTALRMGSFLFAQTASTSPSFWRILALRIGKRRTRLRPEVRNLATAMKNAAKKKYKGLEHCALDLYSKTTSDYAMCYLCALAGTSVLRSNKKDPHDDPEDLYIEHEENLLEVFSDADWAGDKSNRRSVSGCVIFLNGQFVYSFLRTQKTVALSSGEREYHAHTGAVSEAIGIREAVSFVAGKPTTPTRRLQDFYGFRKSVQQEFAQSILFT